MRAWKQFILIVVVLACTCGFAAVRNVPAHYPNIQAAIDDCNDGDVVIVADGLYTGPGNRNIDFGGRAITVRSENGPGGCMIDCQRQDRAFHFHSGEGGDSVVSGLTISRGHTSGFGGGVLCDQSSPAVANCIFSENTASRGGGVANINDSNSTVVNCVFIGNSADYDGGIHNSFSSPHIANCTVVGNSGIVSSGGIGTHGDYRRRDLAKPVITNCLIWGNTLSGSVDRSEQVGVYYSNPVITYCCIQDWSDSWGGSNNFYTDPELSADNYHLTADSPCIDAGDANPEHIASADIDGQVRILNGRVDVGSDEYHPGTVTIQVEPREFSLSYGLGDPALEGQILFVRGTSVGLVNWEAAEGCDWVEVVPDSGQLNGEVEQTVVMIDTDDLAAGAHSCVISISDANAVNSPQYVTVNLDVQRPVIAADRDRFDFTLGPDRSIHRVARLMIRNIGVGVLNWRISSDCDYLVVSPATGRSSGDVQEVTIDIHSIGLDYGEYACHLTIEDANAANSPMIIPVQVNVIRPEIRYQPEGFEFSFAEGRVGTPQTLSISNGTTGTLNWRIACDCNWLIIEPNSGVLDRHSSKVSLRGDTTGLAPGDYGCTITITDPNASNSPQIVPVTLHVSPAVLHVPADYATIQEAIDNAGEAAEVVVQPGTYTGDGNHDIRFRGRAITVRSIDPDNPDIVAATIVDCNSRGGGFIFSEGEDASSVLSGLTIIDSTGGGRCGRRCGGGPAIKVHNSGPLIKNCIIRHNSYGGISVEYGSAVVKSCKIVNNSGYHGGGIFVGDASFVAAENCVISGNNANYGGGIYCSAGSDLVIENSLITGNKSEDSGGGFYCGRYDDMIINSCTITGNSAGERGGGICCDGSSLAISNSVIWNNTAPLGTQIAVSGCFDPRGGHSYPVMISYSDVEGGLSGLHLDPGCTVAGRISSVVDNDPCFAEPGYWGHVDDPVTRVEPNDPNAMWVDGDYHLKSEYGRWEGLSRTWVFDEVTSPCIDRADPNLDWREELWPHGGRANLGAYGGTAEASMSPNDVGNVADLDLDGFVYRTDLPVLLRAWLNEAAPLREDLTRDGIVDFADFGAFAGNYNRPPLPGQAQILRPLDGAVGVSRTPVLGWLSGANARWHNVYLGTESPGVLQDCVSSTTFEPDVLRRNTRYYWRIDEINPGGTTIGEVWSFQTVAGPDRATNPNPPDGALETYTGLTLSWDGGDGATSHDVYFGTSSPGEFQGNQVETTFYLGSLLPDTTYYWRIDEVNDLGTTTGTVWSFTTGGKVRMCFPADTLVWVDGEMVEIGKVAVGAMVEKPAVTQTITELHKKVCAHQIEDIDVHSEYDSWERHDIVFENGSTLAVADSHYFLLDSGKWASVEKLAGGSKLSTLEGSVTVKTVTKSKSSGTVYNLKIKDSERYLVGKDGIIVRDW